MTHLLLLLFVYALVFSFRIVRESSEGQINDLDPLVAVDDAFAPDWVEIGEWLFRHGFLGKLSRGLQFLNAIARSDQHVPEFREVRFVAERAVPRNNLGVI